MQASETLSAVAIEMAFAISPADSPKSFPAAAATDNGQLRCMVETLSHDRDHGGKAALDLVRHGEGQHEFLTGCPGVLGRRKHSPKVVTRMGEPAGRHVAVQKVYVTRKARVEQRCLVNRGLPATNQCATTRGSVFFKLLAEGLERSTWQSSDRAAKAVQNITLEELPHVGFQLLRSRRRRKGSDALNCRSCSFFLM